MLASDCRGSVNTRATDSGAESVVGYMASSTDNLDLCAPTDGQGGVAITNHSFGWLSPRISFSTFVDESAGAGIAMLDTCRRDEKVGKDYGADFEFCMAVASPVSNAHMLPADELFHKGKLLPLYLPPRSQTEILERQVKTPVSISRHISMDSSKTHSPSPGCAGLGGTCARSPKSARWRDLFGGLRRVRSDGGRENAPQDSLHPPDPNASGACAPLGKQPFSPRSLRLIFGRFSSADGKALETSSPRTIRTVLNASNSPLTSPPAASSVAPISASVGECSVPSTSSRKNVSLAAELRGPPSPGLSPLRVRSSVSPSASWNGGVEDPRERRGSARAKENLLARGASISTQGDLRQDAVRTKTRSDPGVIDRNMDRSLPIGPSKGRGISRAPSVPAGVSAPLGPPRLAVRKSERGGSPVRSTSARIVLKNLERCSSPGGKASGKAQEQLRALRAREIKRSPERPTSYSSSVRVTPVLNVPVACMGPVLRGSNVSNRRFWNLRSLLLFRKEKGIKLPSSATSSSSSH